MTEQTPLRIEKIKFLKNQFWILTISAAFSRNKIYKEINKKSIATDQQKNKFRSKLFDHIESLSKNYSKDSYNDDIHKSNIESIVEFSSKHFSGKLQNGGLNIGTAQKILNLYLKYLWCSKLIDFEPPHFPLDRLIQKSNKEEKVVSWTGITKYSEYIKVLKNTYNKNADSKAVWELKTYNQKNQKNHSSDK
ncbi:MAG: hypothetical protein WAT92_02895 [Saprospiraceae bacterium]